MVDFYSIHIFIEFILVLTLFALITIKYDFNLCYEIINIPLLWNYLIVFTFTLSIDELIQLYHIDKLMVAMDIINNILLIFVDDVMIIIMSIINYFVDKKYQKRDGNYIHKSNKYKN